MLILEEFESSADKLTKLLAVMTTLNGENAAAITPEWMQHAMDVLSRTSALMSDGRFAGLKSSSQVNRYRQELQRLKEAVERGQQQLSLQRSAIRAEQARLRQVRALTGTLQSLK